MAGGLLDNDGPHVVGRDIGDKEKADGLLPLTGTGGARHQLVEERSAEAVIFRSKTAINPLLAVGGADSAAGGQAKPRPGSL